MKDFNMQGNDSLWKSVAIPTRTQKLDAQVSSFGDVNECDEFIKKNKAGVIAEGGALFFRLNKPALEEVRVPGGSGIAYRYPHPPTPEVWCIPRCRFEELLAATRFFGFPGSASVADADTVFGEVTALLLQFAHQKTSTIAQIDEAFISVELLRPNDILEQVEADRFMLFNKQHFRVKRAAREERDEKRNWIGRRFFTIGEM